MASPTAWLALAQALATANAGPLIPKPMEMWLTGALSIWRGTVCGWTEPVRRPNRRW